MSAHWKWGTVNIYVNDEGESQEIKRAELNPLDAITSTFHYFGAASKHYSIKGLVIGDTDKASILSDAINNVSRTLTTPWTTVASCYINGTPKFTNKLYGGGTIDGTTYVASSMPLYDLDMEIVS